MADRLDGLITFFASHHAIRAEKTLRKADLAAKMVPGPKELSPNCGVAVRIQYDRRDEAVAALAAKKVQIDEIHPYEPATDDWQSPPAGKRRFWSRDRNES